MKSPPKVRLVPANHALLNALVHDPDGFAAMVGSPIPQGWPEFPEAVTALLERLSSTSDMDTHWAMQFFLDGSSGALVGSGGFHSAPVDRIVEIGYEVAPAFRGLGYGTASARALIARAVASGEIDHVVAHTLPGPNPSTWVLASLGFDNVATVEDPDAGAVWEWRWSRPPVPIDDDALTSGRMGFRNVTARGAEGGYTCPCCGHLTLTERGGYEICAECGWEDDGQDDHDSAEVRGG